MTLRVTLEQAIKNIVAKKALMSESFSVYQVTEAIREMSNKGEIDIMDCKNTKTIAGITIKNIQHSKIKYIFSHQKILPPLYRGVLKDINGKTYMLYIPAAVTQQVADVIDI